MSNPEGKEQPYEWRGIHARCPSCNYDWSIYPDQNIYHFGPRFSIVKQKWWCHRCDNLSMLRDTEHSDFTNFTDSIRRRSVKGNPGGNNVPIDGFFDTGSSGTAMSGKGGV